MKPPLVCLAGGPYLPWQYLSTLVHLVNDRSLIFFDPIGCGPSKRIKKEETQSTTAKDTNKDKTNLSSKDPVPDMVSDLCHLIGHLKLKHYHLFGHSFGGIVAYEALASGTLSGECLSLVLVSTPADLPLALQEVQQLKSGLVPEANSSLEPNQAVEKMFAESYECRVRALPLQLQQSFEMAGFSSSPSSWQTVGTYVVQPPEANDQKVKLPLLLLRGEFDFISEACMEKWQDCFKQHDESQQDSSVTVTTIPGVAHYGMLEDEQAFVANLRTFLSGISEPPIQVPTQSPPAAKK
jgi:pimeloyl-ACP methyl ester carboxylesterase